MRNIILGGVLWLVATVIVTAQSALQPATDIGDRAAGASRVVVASVLDITGRFGTNAHGDQLIFSDVLLEVSETLKGDDTQTLTMTIEGGEVGELKLQVSDMPAVRRGDRALYFLDRSSRGEWVPHRRGLGVVKILSADRLENSGLTLSQARALVRSAHK
jgi:hypothetical protein